MIKVIKYDYLKKMLVRLQEESLMVTTIVFTLYGNDVYESIGPRPIKICTNSYENIEVRYYSLY